MRPVLLLLLLSTPLLPGSPGGPEEPVRYVGSVKTSNSDYADGYHDGQLPPAVGTQNYQILRANRTHPEWSDGMGWTYNHAPMLAHAHGQFYCQYLTNPMGEHVSPGATMLARSRDGKHWTRPQVLFPIYFTARDADSVEYTFMHQRMGFYVAPNGRFLTMGFYGPPSGDGIGRVVREIYEDDSLGPVYFIRVAADWEGPLHYPLYTESSDAGFIEACRAFLADPIRRMQWWEEDRAARDADTFYRVPWITARGRKEPGQAFTFFTRPDGAVVGLFKSRWATLTSDGGQTWSRPVRCESLTYGGAKIWPQALDNGQFALVYNPTDSAARHPLSVAISDDGVRFDGLANVHGEVPVKRFWGREKRPGPQYVRGIVEGNGNPPGRDLWVVYSVNKEDIWISRVPVPVQREVNGPVGDDFSRMETGGVVTGWNVYSPRWCPVEVVEFPGPSKRSLRLQDFDPYDYAKAVRVFEPADEVTLSFDVQVESSAQLLAIEVVSAEGERAIQAQIDTDGAFLVGNGDAPPRAVTRFQTGRWYALELALDTPARRFALRVDGETLLEDASFSTPSGRPERIVLRTGPYRLSDDVQEYKSGAASRPGWDEPGADERVPAAVYYVKAFEAVPCAPACTGDRVERPAARSRTDRLALRVHPPLP
jgi:hypothetical protein